MVNKVQVWIYKEDDQRLTTEIKRLILDRYPDLKGLTMSKAFLFKQVLEYVLTVAESKGSRKK